MNTEKIYQNLYIQAMSYANDMASQRDMLRGALDQAVTSMQDHGYPNSHLAVRAAREALSKSGGSGK